MSLYDGVGLDSKEKGHKDQKSDLMGWSSGIKLLQSQLQLKKAALTQAKREQFRKGAVLAPVVNLKSRRDDLDEMPPPPAIGMNKNLNFEHNCAHLLAAGFPEQLETVREILQPKDEHSCARNLNSAIRHSDVKTGKCYSTKESKSLGSTGSLLGGEWDLRNEYDPSWPNDYEKIMRDKRDKKDRDHDNRRKHSDDKDRDSNHPYQNKHGRRRRDRDRDKDRNREMEKEHEEDLENHEEKKRGYGAAIAPPPSLLESEKREPLPPPPFSGASFQSGLGTSVAARIMAKYGFKEGQGLGKQEQGMSQALQVEKTSKRGGKIIHEKDIPKIVEPPSPPSPPAGSGANQSESITEIMKNPSKVVLLRNMVGPGEVDEELEPETKEECGKYGEVVKCLIFEVSTGDVPEEEAVRIFIEFKRLESAIKAVVDLNGRYFGGRIVRAGFYDQDKFRRLELLD